IVVDAKRFSVRRKCQYTRLGSDHLQSMSCEIEIRNHLRRYRTSHMVQCRTTKPGVDFFGYSTSANNITLLQDERLQPALREITRGHKSIVTTTDDGYVVSHFQSIHRFHRYSVQSA